MSSMNYTSEAVEEVAKEPREAGLKPPTEVTTPLSFRDQLEIKATDEINHE
jgi:hypothetical protein